MCQPDFLTNNFMLIFKKNGFEIPIDSDTVKDTWNGKIGSPIANFIEENKKGHQSQIHKAL